MKAFLQVASLAIFIRTVLIIYGEWQDHFLEVKYTDVDYWVVSDAAVALLTGKSPFIRSTFRYTPMLATLLIPNVYLGNCFGKFLFASFDLLAGYFIYLFLLRSTNSTRAAKLVGVFWLLNPMVFTISTRGNCESILCTLILASIYFLTSKRILLGGLFYGLAVHFRLFPVIYGVAILSYIMTGKLRRSITSSPPISPRATIYPPLNGEDVIKSSTPLTSPNSSPNDSPKLKNRKKRQDLTSQKPNNATVATPHQRINSVNLTSTANRFWSLLLFSISSLVAFGLPTGLSYKVFGAEYLQEALLYHLTRKDHRHNFSPYFYLFYTDAVLKLPQNFELFVFLPQFLVFIMAGIKFGRKDLAYSCFIITFIFVTFNKVITSQVYSPCSSLNLPLLVFCLVPIAFPHGLCVAS